MKYIYIIILSLIYIFLFYSLFTKKLVIIRSSIYLSLFMLIKWIFNHRKCSFGYLECKIRNIKKETGYINNFCEYYGNIIDNEYNYLIFIVTVIIYLINIIKLYFYIDI